MASLGTGGTSVSCPASDQLMRWFPRCADTGGISGRLAHALARVRRTAAGRDRHLGRHHVRAGADPARGPPPRIVPFDGAWMALAEPLARGYPSMVSLDLDPRPSSSSPARSGAGHRAHRRRPCPPAARPLRPALSGRETCRPCSGAGFPPGFHDALALALFEPGRTARRLPGAAVGRPAAAVRAARRRLRRLAPVLAHGIDPMRSLLSAARPRRGGQAGVVMRTDGRSQQLPGLRGGRPPGPLLPRRWPSPVIRSMTGTSTRPSCWPAGGARAGRPRPASPSLARRRTCRGGDRNGPAHAGRPTCVASPRGVEVLGLVVEGYANQEIARTLAVAQRTVAAHLEHSSASSGHREHARRGPRASATVSTSPACLVDGRATMNPVPPPATGQRQDAL